MKSTETTIGEWDCVSCPGGYPVAGDVMLAQRAALETSELATLAVDFQLRGPAGGKMSNVNQPDMACG
jgi:hypothetical protein